MMVSNPLQISTETIIDDIFTKNAKSSKKRINNRFTFLQSDIEEAGLTPTECKVLASINSCMFGNDHAKTNRASLAQKTCYRVETISRSMKRLKYTYNLVDYESTGRGYIIRLTDFCRSIPKLVKYYGQVGLKKLLELFQNLKSIFEKGEDSIPDDPLPESSEVTLDHTRSDPESLLTYNKEFIKEKETAPPSGSARKPSENPSSDPDRQLSADPFLKPINDKVDVYLEQIEKGCKKILSFPKKGAKPFNPFKAVNWARKNGYHPGAITYTINAMADERNWDVIGNPFAWFRSIVSNQSKNFYEKDSMKLASDIKLEERCFSEKVGNLFNQLIGSFKEKKARKNTGLEIDTI